MPTPPEAPRPSDPSPQPDLASDTPPEWLAPLLGDNDLVGSPAPISTVRHAAVGPPPTPDAADQPSAPGAAHAPGAQDAVFFAVVDRHDPNRVVSFHALTRAGGGSSRQWWSFVGDGWVEDAEQAHNERGPLRWVPGSTVQLVVDQLLIVHGMTSATPAPIAPEALHARLEKALVEQSTGHLDVGSAYLQWAGYPQGLLLEVGDAENDGPLAATWAQQLSWLGWQAPDVDNQNAWFQAESPKAVEQAVDLIVRTREVIVNAVAAERKESIEELTAEDLGRAPEPTPEPRRLERVAGDLDELLEILGCDSVEELEDALYNEYDDPDAQLDLDLGYVFVVARFRSGIGVDFPITASRFWALLDEHYAEVDANL